MRIVSYNILDGGTGRVDLIAEVIEAQRPDAVALVEADDPAVVEHLARRLKMDFVHAAGNSHASALLSRAPIRETVNYAPLHNVLTKSLLEATFVDAAGVEWLVGVVHLHARGTLADEAEREKELDILLSLFSSHRQAGRPHLLAGDFNANAPYQQIDPRRCKERTRKEWDQNGGMLPRSAVLRILDAGYVDSLHAVDPAAGATGGTFSTQFPGQRVDYIFTHNFPQSRLKAAWVERDGAAKDASDHFPVGVEIE